MKIKIMDRSKYLFTSDLFPSIITLTLLFFILIISIPNISSVDPDIQSSYEFTINTVDNNYTIYLQITEYDENNVEFTFLQFNTLNTNLNTTFYFGPAYYFEQRYSEYNLILTDRMHSLIHRLNSSVFGYNFYFVDRESLTVSKPAFTSIEAGYGPVELDYINKGMVWIVIIWIYSVIFVNTTYLKYKYKSINTKDVGKSENLSTSTILGILLFVLILIITQKYTFFLQTNPNYILFLNVYLFTSIFIVLYLLIYEKLTNTCISNNYNPSFIHSYSTTLVSIAFAYYIWLNSINQTHSITSISNANLIVLIICNSSGITLFLLFKQVWKNQSSRKISNFNLRVILKLISYAILGALSYLAILILITIILII